MENTHPYLVVPNAVTGRIEFYREYKGEERIVASLNGTATNVEIMATCAKLERDGL